MNTDDGHLAHLRARMHDASEQLTQARADYHAAIAAQLRQGTTQAELARQTGYPREHIRRIARAAGIGPAR